MPTNKWPDAPISLSHYDGKITRNFYEDHQRLWSQWSWQDMRSKKKS